MPVKDHSEAFDNAEPAGTDTVPADQDLETSEVPDELVAEFSSLTTPYCWVITEDLVARYDGAEPSAVGKSGPEEAVAEDVREALTSGRFFRLADGHGDALVIGRLYDPSGENERAPLDDFRQVSSGAARIEYRNDGQWESI
jgi:hypothetical protein